MLHRLLALVVPFLMLIPGAVYGQGQPLTAHWDPNPPVDQVSEYQVCLGTSSLSCSVAQTRIPRDQTSFAFTAGPGVLYHFAVRAITGSVTGGYSAEVTASIPNFVQPPNQASSVNVPITPLNLTVSDPDGGSLQFSHTGLPLGMSVHPATGRITGTPTATGAYNVTIGVFDGLVMVFRSFVWTVGDSIAPTLTIASHTSGQTVSSASATVFGTATDGGAGGSGIARVTINGQAAAGGAATGNGTATWSRSLTLSTGANVLAMQATDGAGNTRTTQLALTVSAPQPQPNPTPPPPSSTPTATAAFLWADEATKGTWQGAYGRAGYVLANEDSRLPSFAEVTPAGHASYTWAASTSDVRALQKAGTTGRSAKTWYTPRVHAFTIDLKLTDAQAHHVAVYAVDWDSRARQQQIEVLDATTGTILDQRDITGFNGGRYLVWRLSGHVRLRVTRVAGANAVVSAVFFDPVGTAPPDLGAGAGSPAGSATFLRVDTTTQGTWQGSYGRTGYVLANDGSTLPGFAQVTPAGHLSYTWSASTTNQRALQKAGTTDRKAAAWYTPAHENIFAIDLELTTAQPRQVAVYAVDWDSTSRRQRIEVLDAATGTVLDRREMTGFSAGRYLVWQLSGHVRLRVTRLGGTNAVVSAVFLD